jgi:LytS/YehU family sensor histidine kinase
LLNTLNTISGLVTEDPRDARELVAALGDLLRDSLEDGDEMQPLDDEIAWLRRYAAILEIRHRGSLAFHWEIADPARRVRIPRLLLQPLVENAVKHGALRRREGGEVSVRATIDNARVTCIVEDNGPGPAAGSPRDGARGLELVTKRLALEYAGTAAFRLETSGGYTRSIVELPVERAP